MYYVKVKACDGIHFRGKSDSLIEAKKIMLDWAGFNHKPEEFDREEIQIDGSHIYIDKLSRAMDSAFEIWNCYEYPEALEFLCSRGCVRHHHYEDWEVCDCLEIDGSCALEYYFQRPFIGMWKHL